MGTIGRQELVDTKFSEQSTSVYNLSVLAGTDRLSYFVQDSQHTVILLRSYDFPERGPSNDFAEKIRNVYLQDEWIRLPYKRISFGLLDPIATLVPGRLYQKGMERAYLEAMSQLADSDNLHADFVEPLGLYNAYRVPKGVQELIQKSFEGARLYHHHTALLLAFYKLAASRSGHRMFLNIRQQWVQIAVFDQRDLLFCNAFQFQSGKDFIYYVMLTFDQLGLKPEVVPVVLSGQITAQSENYRLLYRYIRHLTLVQKPDYLQFGSAFDQLPPHFFFDLYSLQLC
ncbi:MAG: DUF3822 family protein, partial [Bacteroidota bacterium]